LPPWGPDQRNHQKTDELSTDFGLLPPPILSHVVATRSPRSIKRDFTALVRILQDSGAQVVLSSMLLVMLKDIGRNRCAQYINTWLQGWCHWY